MDTPNGHTTALADEAGELYPTYPRIELETTVTFEGFTFRVTFRDTSLAEAIKVLQRRGCQPTTSPAVSQPAPANGAPPICPVHNKPMKPSQKSGWFCSQKVGDDYCKERAK
jgi:hypothetical protein